MSQQNLEAKARTDGHSRKLFSPSFAEENIMVPD